MRWAGWVSTTRTLAWARRLPVPVRVAAATAALAAAAAGVLAPAAPLVEPPGVVLVEPVAPADGGARIPLALPPVAPQTAEPPLGATSAAAVPAALELGEDSLGIPGVVLGAYQRAAATLARQDAACHLAWPLLAGIGKVESGHARGGDVDRTGLTRAPILGPVLDGHPGTAAIHDTDGGRWDENTVWDRAVGPMQFIPTSWVRHGVDGNGDRVADPSNVFDATLSAAGYLCAGGGDLATPAGLHAAVLSYNHSEAYVATVLAWMQAYASGAVATTAVGLATYGPVVVVPAVSRTTSTGTTPAATPSPAPTASPSPSPSPSPSSSPSPSGSPDPSASPTPTPTPTPTGCPTPDPTATPDPSPTPSADAAMPTPTPTASPDPSTSPDPGATADPGTVPADGCPTVTPTPTDAGTPTPTDPATPASAG
jgi:hypothetical protein